MPLYEPIGATNRLSPGYSDPHRWDYTPPGDANLSQPGWVAQNPFAAPGSGTPGFYVDANGTWQSGAAPTTPGTLPSGAPSGGAFNPNPAPHAGVGAFGAVPGQLGLPSPAADLSAQIPGLSGLNAAASSNILAQLHGELPQDVLDQIQNSAARFGVSSGMPGSGLAGNRSLRDVGLTSLQQQQAGLGNLNQLAAQTSQTQTLNPALQAEIANQNAVNAAAPDPTQRAAYSKQLYDQYLASIGKTGGSTTVRPPTVPGAYTGAIGGQATFGAQNPYSGGGQFSSYDANGYPYSSYQPGPGGGTNATANPQAQPYGNYGTDYGVQNGGALPDWLSTEYLQGGSPGLGGVNDFNWWDN